MSHWDTNIYFMEAFIVCLSDYIVYVVYNNCAVNYTEGINPTPNQNQKQVTKI